MTSRLPGRLFAAIGGVLALAVAPQIAEGSVRFVSPSGADSGGCQSSRSACRGLGYAYGQAAPGDTVEVAAGTYPSQAIPAVPGRVGPAVEFRPAAGASVALGGLDIGASQVTVRDLRTGFLSVNRDPAPVQDVRIVNGGGPGIWIDGVRNLAIEGGSYGPLQDRPIVQIAGAPASSDILFDRVEFHDATVSRASVHSECIWAAGVERFEIRDSVFRNCAYFDVFFTRFNGPDPKDVLLEGNTFGTTKQYGGADAPYVINISNWLSKVERFTLRDNVFGGDVAIQPDAIADMKMVGNVGPIGSCKDGVEYSFNVWTRLRCGPTDRVSGGNLGI